MSSNQESLATASKSSWKFMKEKKEKMYNKTTKRQRVEIKLKAYSVKML